MKGACGMTMHGDREGANAMLRSAPTALLEAFQAAKASGRFLDFFRQAFDRQADPCLEGRTSRLLHFLESHRLTSTSAAPWEDVSLRPLAADAAIKDVAGEHLRVFGNECTWQWSRQREMSYEEAQRARFSGDDAAAEDFARLFNAESFSRAMRARGVVRRRAAARWEAHAEPRALYLSEISGRGCGVSGMKEMCNFSGMVFSKPSCALHGDIWRPLVSKPSFNVSQPRIASRFPKRFKFEWAGASGRRQLEPLR
ncbi:unnamed protein product [Effrenium voratum]|nr:unnamed protein product [Effrenium voratum]